MPLLRKHDVFRRELLAEPFSKEWDGWLSANMAHYPLLSAAERTELQNVIRIIVAEKKWEGCDRLKVTEMMKVMIAGQAALLLLGLEHDYFARVSSVVLFPQAFELPAESHEVRGRTILGQAVDYGSVFLSWDAVLRDAREPKFGHNLVIHEFAHQLDFLDGYTNGVPPLRNRDQTKRWELVMLGTFQRLRRAIQQGEATFLGAYAAKDPAEFFSVASEKFFLVPGALRENHPELFEVLHEYYGVDSLRWFEGEGQMAPAIRLAVKNESGVSERGADAALISSDGDFIDFACPYCGQNLSFPKADAGKLKECPNCLECAVVPERSGILAKRIPVSIRTQRITLERLKVHDGEDFAELLSDDANLRYLEWNSISKEEAEEWISSEARMGRFPKAAESSCCYLAVKAPKIIGFVVLWHDPAPHNRVDFEVIINRGWQRKGYGIEAVRGVLRYSFESLRARRVVASCDSRNVAARQLLLKAGMRQESEGIEDHFVKGEWVNTVGFAVLQREFKF
jgi:hypothetical protein